MQEQLTTSMIHFYQGKTQLTREILKKNLLEESNFS